MLLEAFCIGVVHMVVHYYILKVFWHDIW